MGRRRKKWKGERMARKKLDDVGAENLPKITANVQKRWRGSRSGLIFCRMKILTMSRKKAQIAMLNAPWSWPTSDSCTVGNTEALNSGGFRCCFLRLRCSSGPQGLRGLPQGLTSGPHFYLRASPAQKLPIILDQGPPRFLRGPEVNFPNKWMATVQSTSQACQVKWYSNCSK